MHELEWYAFNKTPLEIAQRVTEILVDARWCVLADGNRFDAHVSRRARILERIVMLRYFARQHHSALNEAMDEQIGVSGTTECGRRYNSGYGRGSGSIETSNFNSLVSAFIGYCAHRNTLVNGVKKTPEEAWASLGMYGGDDSIEGDVDPNALKFSSTQLGQDYEITTLVRGSMGVNFLNRFYGPDVWTGDPNSMANSKRLLAKLFVGPAALRDVLTRLGERLSGYYRMDKNSPVIGEIARVSVDLLGESEEGELMPWDGTYDTDTNWPNEDSGWMQTMFDSFIPDFDHERFASWISLMKSSADPSMLLQAPMCTDPSTPINVKLDSVVDDQLYQVPATPVEVPTPKDYQEELENALAAAFEVPPEVTEAQTAVPVPKPLAAKGKRSQQKASPAKTKPTNPKHPANWVVPPKKQGQSDKAYAKFVQRFEERRATALARGSKRQ